MSFSLYSAGAEWNFARANFIIQPYLVPCWRPPEPWFNLGHSLSGKNHGKNRGTSLTRKNRGFSRGRSPGVNSCGLPLSYLLSMSSLPVPLLSSSSLFSCRWWCSCPGWTRRPCFPRALDYLRPARFNLQKSWESSARLRINMQKGQPELSVHSLLHLCFLALPFSEIESCQPPVGSP